jgi:DNA invertase Pin-like site-specific DNA recombinase
MREFFLDPKTRRTDCLNGYGIQWRSFTDCYLDSTGTFRDAIISILATLAKQERIRLSERTKAGLERARKQGGRL